MTSASPASGGYRWVVVGNGENRRVRSFRAAARGGRAARATRGGLARRAARRRASLRRRRTGAAGFARRARRGGPSPARGRRSDPGGGHRALVRRFRGSGRIAAAAAAGSTIPRNWLCCSTSGCAMRGWPPPGVAVPASPTSGTMEPVRDWADLRARMRSARSVARIREARTRIVGLGGARPGNPSRGPDPRHDLGRGHAPRAPAQLAAGTALSPRVRDRRDRRPAGPRRPARRAVGAQGSLQGRSCDLRVLVVAGRATHVVRGEPAVPMTNLHLGGERGDPDAVRAAAGERWARALELAERAAGVFPRHAVRRRRPAADRAWREFAVAEVNAFGDLLPRLTGLPGSPAGGWTPTRPRSRPLRAGTVRCAPHSHRRTSMYRA